MLIVGLTGGIGSGKTAVADLFKQAGVQIIDADEIGRHLSQKGQAGYEAIIKEFGAGMIADGGELNREKLRDTVFKDNNKRKRLESLLHPLIRDEIAGKLKQLKTEPYCIIVVPLLIETDYHTLVDRILVVDTTERNQIERVIQRDNLSHDKVKKIMRAQLSRTKRLQQADDVIENNSDISHLKDAVGVLHKHYLELA
ncbi:MAG: dephospho-CoA kinase [Proteobacteria bacterium]|nr:dephospho-CoA kinase [Pseudomonadota bacterium]